MRVLLCSYRPHVHAAGWREERKESLERGGKEKSEKKKRKGKGLMGFVALFRFVHCVFHSFLSPLSIHHATTLLLTLTLTTLHCTPQHTIAHREHATQSRLCAVVFLVCVLLCLCVTVCLLIPHSTKQHNTMETGNHHMGQPMDEAMSEWEGAVVCVDTTAQTQGTRRK